MRLLVLGGTGGGRVLAPGTSERPIQAGLRNRPFEQTARDTHAALRPEDRLPLDPAVEARLIG